MSAIASPDLSSEPKSLYGRIPLFVKILVGLMLGLIVGYCWGPGAAVLRPISLSILTLLRLLATPLVFLAILHAIIHTPISGKSGMRLFYFIFTNTIAAILIGLLVANLLQPGATAHLRPEGTALVADKKAFNMGEDLLQKFIPTNLIDGFRENEIIPVLALAVAFGIALRGVRRKVGVAAETDGVATLTALCDTFFQAVMVMLHWLFHLVPLAVFAVVAATVGTQGFGPLLKMANFVGAVLVALGLQGVFYLVRLRFGSWVRPAIFLKHSADALLTAFSTSSSAATLPVTFAAARDKIKVREQNASLGVMVGGTFNHDGTALYEAMAALFISQGLGMHLSFLQQVVVVIMSVIASAGAAGIPEAGLVTMMAVFSAVHLPVEFIPLLLPLDWFLDRCRTAMNVMGDLTVTCLLDGKTSEAAALASLPAGEGLEPV
ncbi:MAG: dicarboxylate/amino acid:cation symporter [Chthoniobacter sp.]|uniref:dicarboxylate/amino acid:cation symporter n=1 Tax=Chthoniobacter sp. TaxID=2510640 RepID=UPI0032A4D0DC